MIHNFTGGIIPSGRLPRNDIALNIFGADSEQVAEPASKPISEYTREELIAATQTLGVFDSRRNEYLCDVFSQTEVSERVVINCCESDPYAVSTSALCLDSIEQLMLGSAVLLYAFNAQKVIFCCDKRSKALIAQIKKRVGNRKDMALAVIADKYPVNTRTLIGALYCAGNVYMQDVDIRKYAVISAEAAIKLYDGLRSGMRQDHKTFSLFVDGEPPVAVKAPVGTALLDILRDFGIAVGTDCIVGYGSTYNFKSIGLENAHIEADTERIRIAYAVRRYEAGECIRCGRCSIVCPLQLDVMRAVVSDGKRMPKKLDVCFECGCCTYICPSHIDVMQLIKSIKSINEPETETEPETESESETEPKTEPIQTEEQHDEHPDTTV